MAPISSFHTATAVVPDADIATCGLPPSPIDGDNIAVGPHVPASRLRAWIRSWLPSERRHKATAREASRLADVSQEVTFCPGADTVVSGSRDSAAAAGDAMPRAIADEIRTA